MNQLLRIDSILYKVDDLEKSAKFYEQNLGMRIAWRDYSSKMIGLVFRSSRDSEIVLHNDESIPNYDFSFIVRNVNDFVEEYKSKGLKVKVEPKDIRCGRYAILLDLDNNIIPILDLTKFNNKPRYD